jgi:hypothetical protein
MAGKIESLVWAAQKQICTMVMAASMASGRTGRVAALGTNISTRMCAGADILAYVPYFSLFYQIPY